MARAKKYRRIILAVRGDTQGGHAGGLLNPETQIPTYVIDPVTKDKVLEGWHTPELRPVQRQLWEWHEQDREKIGELAGTDELVMLEMGDLTQGSVFKDDLDETSLSAQVVISAYSMYPWLEMRQVRRVYMSRGTGVHLWGEAATETLLTRLLSSEYKKKSIRLVDHWLLDIDGFLIDVAHHGPGAGKRAWTRGNVLQLYTQSIMMDEIIAGRQPPNLLLRAHHHEYTPRPATVQAGGKVWRCDACITPPECFIGSHAQKVCESPSSMSVGMLAFEILDGRLLETHPFIHTIDLRTREIL